MGQVEWSNISWSTWGESSMHLGWLHIATLNKVHPEKNCENVVGESLHPDFSLHLRIVSTCIPHAWINQLLGASQDLPDGLATSFFGATESTEAFELLVWVMPLKLTRALTFRWKAPSRLRKVEALITPLPSTSKNSNAALISSSLTRIPPRAFVSVFSAC